MNEGAKAGESSPLGGLDSTRVQEKTPFGLREVREKAVRRLDQSKSRAASDTSPARCASPLASLHPKSSFADATENRGQRGYR
jgi:hypothetical protein